MNLIRYGEKFFDELEIAIYRKREVAVDAALNQVSMSSSSTRHITVIRGIKDKKMGIYIVDSEDEEKIKRGIEIAAKNAMSNQADEKWSSLPGAQEYRSERKVEFSTYEPDYYVEVINKAIEDIRKGDENAMVAGGDAGSIWSKNTIMNSHGIDISQELGASFFYIYAVGMKDGMVTPGMIEYDIRMKGELDREFVTNSILRKLEKAYKQVRAEGSEAKVIVEPLAMGMLLYFSLIPAINGERRIKETSPLVGKEGERVLSEKISMYDDPWHPMSINPIVADDEGVATRRNVIFDKGIFKGFLWDSYWGNVDERGSTGNGTRNLTTGGIRIAPNNLVIENGSRKLEDIIGDIDKGYYVSGFQGAHSSNPDTGDFSVVANPAFKIEDGEIVGTTVFMMSGNIYSLLSRVDEVSSEARKILMVGNGVFPYLSFEDVKIAPVSK